MNRPTHFGAWVPDESAADAKTFSLGNVETPGIDPDQSLRELAAGSLYEGGLADKFGNSCHYVRLELDSAGRPVEAMLRFRSFSPRSAHWFDNDGLYRESKAGRLRWKFRSASKPAEPNPYSPWEPKPEQCFGRHDLFHRLEAALEERRSLCGWWETRAPGRA